MAATRTFRPAAIASLTAATTSPSSRGRTTATGWQVWLPTQFVQVALPTMPASLAPRGCRA